MLNINPQILKKDGKPAFVILPYDDYISLTEQIEDEQDSKLIAESRKKNEGKKGYSLAEVKAKLGV